MIIDTTIPSPDTSSTQNFKWPFAEMNVGDSFAVESKKSRQCSSSAIRFSKKTGTKFAIRIYEDAHRCWRIE